MNVCVLVGYVATEPTTGTTSKQETHARFRLAVSTGKDTADFFTVKCFGRTAEVVAQYATKGQRVAVNGRLATNTWERDGVTTRDVEIVAGRVELLGRSDNTLAHEPLTSPTIGDEIPF